jgi:hypothetical protein
VRVEIELGVHRYLSRVDYTAGTLAARVAGGLFATIIVLGTITLIVETKRRRRSLGRAAPGDTSDLELPTISRSKRTLMTSAC